MNYLTKIDKTRVPRHIAIIMDGNGRWAKSHGQERIFGHFNGVEAVRSSLKACVELGVQYLTLYAFSTENWNRPKDEVDALMDLLVKTIVSEMEELQENHVKLHAIGDIENLPEACQNELKRGMALTGKNSKIQLNLALSYSSRWEISRAIKKMIEDGLKPSEVTDSAISEYLSTKGIPDPELLIRTSGEKRISNFLLWQIAYTELYFTDTLWPDFNKEELFKAVYDYQNRERRFGKTSEQLAL